MRPRPTGDFRRDRRRCLNKIINVSEDAGPAVKAQADAFRDQIWPFVLYMREAISSDRTTVCNALAEAGQQDLANDQETLTWRLAETLCTSFKELMEGVHNFKNSGGSTFKLACMTTMRASLRQPLRTQPVRGGTGYSAGGAPQS